MKPVNPHIRDRGVYNARNSSITGGKVQNTIDNRIASDPDLDLFKLQDKVAQANRIRRRVPIHNAQKFMRSLPKDVLNDPANREKILAAMRQVADRSAIEFDSGRKMAAKQFSDDFAQRNSTTIIKDGLKTLSEEGKMKKIRNKFKNWMGKKSSRASRKAQKKVMDDQEVGQDIDPNLIDNLMKAAKRGEAESKKAKHIAFGESAKINARLALAQKILEGLQQASKDSLASGREYSKAKKDLASHEEKIKNAEDAHRVWATTRQKERSVTTAANKHEADKRKIKTKGKRALERPVTRAQTTARTNRNKNERK